MAILATILAVGFGIESWAAITDRPSPFLDRLP